ncbi:MAG: tetratricopeptide repeat protein [Candidatus Tectomicrobia bacterium]|nr:tetratricopeptide repeat protein [Candidatus Tectomicrobia bacterium]
MRDAVWGHRCTVIIDGIAGAGKSELAKEFAKDWQGRTLIWIEAESIDAPGVLVDRVADWLPQEQAERLRQSNAAAATATPAELAQLLAREIETCGGALFLDAYERVLNRGEAAEPLNELLACLNGLLETGHLIVTSRRGLPFLHDAVSIAGGSLGGLDERAGAAVLGRLGLAAEPVELRRQASQRVGGYPKLLELLAARAVVRGLRQVVDELPQGTQAIQTYLLDELVTPLPEEQRALLAGLSLMRRPVPFAALTALSGQDDANTENLLAPLFLAHLVDRDETPAYRVHHLIGDYLSSTIEPEQQRQLHLRAANYYASPHAEVTQETYPEFLETFHHLCEARDYDGACSFFFAHDLDERLDRWGHARLLVEVYERLLPQHPEEPPRLSEKQHQGAVLGNLGICYQNLGEVPRAIDCHEQALAISREIGDRRGEGNQLGNLGLCYQDLGEVGRAIDNYEQALAISREIGDRRVEGNALGNLGNCYQDLGEVGRAIDYHKQALASSREIRDRRGEGSDLGNLGICYRLQGEVGHAIDYHQQALAIHHEIGNRQGEGSALGNLGICYWNLGEVPRAIEHLEQALAINRDIGDRRGEGNALGNLGNCYQDLGEVGRAIDCHKQALAISREIGDRRGEGSDLGNLGICYQGLGDAPRAIDCHEQALAISREIGDRRGEGNALGNLGLCYRHRDEVGRAIEHYKQALVISREIGDRRGEGSQLGNLGVAFVRQQRFDRALACRLRSADIFRQIQSPEADKPEREIALLRQHLGDEAFARLEAEVRPRLEAIIEEIVAEGRAAARPERSG